MTVDQTHETPIHGDLNTIAGGFSRGGNSTFKRKRYAQAVMSLNIWRYGRPTNVEPSGVQCFEESKSFGGC